MRDAAYNPSNEYSGSRVKSTKLSYGSPQVTEDSQWHSPTPFCAFGRASPLTVNRHSLGKKEPGAPHDHVATGPPLQGVNSFQSEVDSTSAQTLHTGTRAELLELYITEKKQSYMHYLQQRADLLRQREKDARDCIEEQSVEIELADSGRITLPMEACAVHRHIDASFPKEVCEDSKASAIAPLELEASTLLKLLPPLRRSVQEASDPEISSKQCARIPRYYPYLAPKLPELILEDGNMDVTAEDLSDSSQSQGKESHNSHNIRTRQARVVAFHNAGYGMGYVDFEACSDWICLPKRSKA